MKKKDGGIMGNYEVIDTKLSDISSDERLAYWFKKQKELKQPIYYLLPSTKWIFQARKLQPGLAFKTFDDIAKTILERVNVSYLGLSEYERTLFFQQFLAEDDVASLSSKEEEHHRAEALADTYGQLKRLNLTVDELPSSLLSMKPLFHRYEQLTVEFRKMLDPENIIHQAITSPLQEHLNIGAVVVDGYFDFNPLQYAILKRLIKENIPVTIYLPTLPSLALFEKTIQFLAELGFSSKKSAKIMVEKVNKIQIQSATTKEEEILAIFESVLIEEKRLEEVGIVMVDEYNDRPMIERLAEKRGIPLQQAKTLPLNETAVLSFLKAFLMHKGQFETKWDVLALFEPLAKLLCMRSHDYLLEKRMLIMNGRVKSESVARFIEQIKQAKQLFKQEMPFVDYLEQTIALLKSLELEQHWRARMQEEDETQELKKISIETQALERITHLLEEQANVLQERKLEDIMLHRYIYRRWLEETAKNTSLYLERGSRFGLSLYSLREAALFQGTHLYVIGMNEGVFPRSSQLAGYFQEKDLYELGSRPGLPTKSYTRDKQDGYFRQLFYLAETLTFSFITGLDKNNPLLASPYLAEMKRAQLLTHHNSEYRLSKMLDGKAVYFSDADYLEKTAYHLGRGFSLVSPPTKLVEMKERLERLKTGEETVPHEITEELATNTIAITALESYASCSFRYGMERILRVHEPEMIETDVSPLALGSLFHSLIETFYKKINAVRRPFSDLSEQEKDAALPVLLDLFAKKWGELEKSVPMISRFDLQLKKEQLEKQLRRWWAAERKLFWDNEKLGNMEIWKQEEPVTYLLTEDDQSILLTGKIDRIDRDENGFVVYDYKSGQERFKLEKEMKNGLKLQLPIYLASIESLLDKEGYGASYISLKEPQQRTNNGMWIESEIGKGSRFNVSSYCKNSAETLETEKLFQTYELKKTIIALSKGMRREFPVKPQVCFQFCPYQAVCRVTDDLKQEGEMANGL